MPCGCIRPFERHNAQSVNVLLALCDSSIHILAVYIPTNTRCHPSLLANAGTPLAIAELVVLIT